MVAAEEKALWWCTQTRRGMTQSLQSHCWFFSSDRAQTVKLRIEIDYNLICWCTTHTTKNTQVHLLTNSFPFLSAQKASSNQNDTSMLSYRRVYLLSCQFYQASNLNFFEKDTNSGADIQIKDTIWICCEVQLCFPWAWSCWCDYCPGRAPSGWEEIYSKRHSGSSKWAYFQSKLEIL